MSKNECNILSKLSSEEYRIVRRRIIECILSTDPNNHAKVYSLLKSRLSEGSKDGDCFESLIGENITKNFDSQQIVLNVILHASDVSNPCKPLVVYKTWVGLIFEEFFGQGDLEKEIGLPISVLCDRQSITIEKSQIGFINFIVKPIFECIIIILPECQQYLTNCCENRIYYENQYKERYGS